VKPLQDEEGLMDSTVATATPETAQPSDGQATVVVRDLHKQYGSFHAVSGISFTARKGEIFALLGTNGAGKSTAIEILEGYQDATSGDVEVLGMYPKRDAKKLKERIGLTLQTTAAIRGAPRRRGAGAILQLLR
jgi:ABC-type sugar transport system ATPase subunit